MKSTWGARSVKVNQTIEIVEQYENLLESLISVGRIKQALGWEKSYAEVTAWSFDMEGHAKKCVARFFEIANTNSRNSAQSPHLVSTTASSKKMELETVGYQKLVLTWS